MRERTADRVLADLSRLMRVDLSDAESEKLLVYLNTHASIENEELVLEPSPFDGKDPRHLDERVRGLLLMLTQHPSYHLR